MARRLVPAALRFAPLLAVALLAAGCGKSKERELYEQREAACASLQGLTISAARATLLNREDLVFCSAPTDPEPLNRLPGGDTCGGTPTGPYAEPVCQVYFLWIANDPALCNDSTGCTYGCEARITPGEATAIDDLLVCALSWVP